MQTATDNTLQCAMMSSDEDRELIQSFVSESQDMIDTVEPILIGLMKSEGVADLEAINNIFRLFHSMKGSAGFLKMENITAVTHQAETLLAAFRRKETTMDSYYVGIELGVVDKIRDMLEHVATNQTDCGMEESRVAALAALAEATRRLERSVKSEGESGSIFLPSTGGAATAAEQSAVEGGSGEIEAALPEFVTTPEMSVRFAQESNELIDTAEQCLLALSGKSVEARNITLDEVFRLVHSFKGNCGFMGIADLERLSHKLETVLAAVRTGSIEAIEGNVEIMLKVLDILRSGLVSYSRGEGGTICNCDMMLAFLDDLLPKDQSRSAKAPVHEEARRIDLPVVSSAETVEPKGGNDLSSSLTATGKGIDTSQSDQRAVRKDIRVDLEKLDNLINLVGELVVAETMVLRNPALKRLKDKSLNRAIRHLGRVSAGLQDVAMSVRMIPLATTFKKMIRLIHDLSMKSEKKVNAELIGEETEVDKNVIEQISDPLVHLIRNSIDHGIEPPEERLRLGKTEKGTVVIEAKHDGGEVVIIVGDDGRGLDRDKILRKAIEKGLVKGTPSHMPDEEVHALIFEPGFSTAEKLTDISGRGVGMDVVKRNIEKLNGRVDIRTTPGAGTSIVIRIPLTLAIIDGMLVRVGDSQYAIPLLAVRASIRPEARMVVHTPDGQDVVRVRSELLPVVRLHQLYRKSDAVTELEKGILVIVESDGGVAALLVDEIIGQHQIVIKGLSSYLGSPMGISGCAIQGDGHVSLIIDVNSLLKCLATRQM